MEDDSLSEDCDITMGEAKVRLNQSECICNQPTATGDTEDTHTFPPHHPHHHHPPSLGNNLFSPSPAPSETYPAPFRADPAHIKEASGDDTHTFPPHHPHHHHPPSPGNNLLSPSPAPSETYPAPFRADPAHIKEASGDDTHTFPPHDPPHHHPPSPGNNLLSPSPAPSETYPAPFRADPAHIKEASGDDLCLRCVLSCLYCELISICSTLEACLTCPGGGAICCCDAICCCCCCSGEAEGVACGEEACQALADCGIVEDCCSSTDLLDFSLECCSFFFPS